jgi:hypothetical protein
VRDNDCGPCRRAARLLLSHCASGRAALHSLATLDLGLPVRSMPAEPYTVSDRWGSSCWTMGRLLDTSPRLDPNHSWPDDDCQ